jgi:hypothetical protein
MADFTARSGCAGATDTACVDAFLQASARRAFHGTLDPADVAHLDAIAAELRSVDPGLATQTAIEFILMSPRFLYVVEFGTQGAAMSPLTPSEVAGRLAAFFWRSVPDSALLQAADSGALDTPDGVRAQAAAMLSDPRALPMLESFVNQWLRISGALPDAPALEQQIAAQPGALMGRAAEDASLTFAHLIQGASAPIGVELAALYGTSVDANGMASLPPERQGLLLSAAFLSSNASGDRPSPVKRGFTIRRSLLCETIPPPTDPLAMQLPEVGSGITEQQAFNQHSSLEECWLCHKFMDPLGDAFGMYDAQGNYAPELTTVTGGTVYFAGNHDPPEMPFADTAALLELLQTDATPRQCFVLQALRFALGRGETSRDACGVEAITNAVEGELSVQQLMIEVAASPQFLNRNPVVAGGTCR